jgi:hypothetical protein
MRKTRAQIKQEVIDKLENRNKFYTFQSYNLKGILEGRRIKQDVKTIKISKTRP